MENRAGRYINKSSGYSVFYPERLPPKPPIQVEGKLQEQLLKADRVLGRLDGSILTLPILGFSYMPAPAALLRRKSEFSFDSGTGHLYFCCIGRITLVPIFLLKKSSALLHPEKRSYFYENNKRTQSVPCYKQGVLSGENNS